MKSINFVFVHVQREKYRQLRVTRAVSFVGSCKGAFLDVLHHNFWGNNGNRRPHEVFSVVLEVSPRKIGVQKFHDVHSR